VPFPSTNDGCSIACCWIQERIPDVKDEEWKTRQIVSYYQWVPVILLVMSVMSLVPTLLWRFLSRRSGIDVSALMMSAVAGQQAGYAELRERTVRYVVNQVGLRHISPC